VLRASAVEATPERTVLSQALSREPVSPCYRTFPQVNLTFAIGFFLVNATSKV
jgi:hypothetical protein